MRCNVMGAVLALAGAATLAPAADAQKARLDRSASSRLLQKTPRVAGDKPVVAIYEVRSAVPEIQPRAAADMLMTALIKSGAFQVAERTRLNEGVGRERQLMTAGTAAAAATPMLPYASARYVIEVVISEAAVARDRHDNSFFLSGAQLGHKGGSDQIAMDIRITDVATGLVLDAVDTVADIDARSKQVSGLGGLASGLLRRAGARGGVPMGADATISTSHSDGVDRALRYCIETGVAELARRLPHPG